MAKIFGLLFCICVFFRIQGIFGENCYKDNYNGYRTTIYCSYGCCGTSSNRYCCYYGSNRHAVASIGVIVGCSVGGLLFLGLIIIGCVCICAKNKGSRGRVVVPSTGAGIAMIVTHGHQQNAGYVYGLSHSNNQGYRTNTFTPSNTTNPTPQLACTAPGATAFPENTGENLPFQTQNKST